MAEEKKAEKKDRFKLAKEFKAFISRGNVLDMAVGLIIGSAFTAIVNSLVGDLLMPLLGLLIGKMDFSQLKLVLHPAVEEVLNETGAVVTPAVAEISLNYGSFIQSVISFLLIALAVFILVRLSQSSTARRKKSPSPSLSRIPRSFCLLKYAICLRKRKLP